MERNPEISIKDLDLADQYLLGQMDEEQAGEFERRLSDDPLLASQVQQLRMIGTGIGEARLLEKMNMFHAGLVKTGSGKAEPVMTAVSGSRPQAGEGQRKTPVIPLRSRVMKTMMLAASVLLLLGLGFWMVTRNAHTDAQLYAAYFDKDPGLMTTMSTAGNYSFERAMVDYKNGEYESAISAWTSLAAAAPTNDSLNYFIASAYMADQQQALAIPFFQKVLAAPAGAFTEETYWYLGLAHLKLGNTGEAVRFLRQSVREERGELIRKIPQ